MPTELQGIHADLIVVIHRAETLVTGDPPDAEALVEARWELRRASRRRTRHVDEVVLPLLLAWATPAEAAALTALRERNAPRLAASADHAARWPIERALGDWLTYRVAAAAFLGRMRERVLDEQQVLYPMIEAWCGRTARR